MGGIGRCSPNTRQERGVLERSHKPWLRAAQQKNGLLAKLPDSKQAAVKLLWWASGPPVHPTKTGGRLAPCWFLIENVSR